jgi:membrane-associated phospholipid phosphatase
MGHARVHYDVARMHVRRGLAALVLMVVAAQPAAGQNTPAEPAAPVSSAPPAAQAPDSFGPDPFIHLIPNTLHDLKALASVETAWTLGIGGGLAAAAHQADDWATERAGGSDTNRFFDLGGNSGSGYIQIGGAVVTYAAGRIAGSPRTAHIGTDLIRAQVLSGIVTHGLKVTVQRHRPGRTDGSFSFPSGHTSATWATASVLWRHFGWKVGAPVAAVGVWVAGGRVQQRQHFLSDVVFGAAVGIAGGRTVTIGHGRRALSLRPAPVPGGMALLFTPASH